MNISFTPLLADIYALGEIMNRFQFAVGCAIAVCAIILSFLPRKPMFMHGLSIGSALLGLAVVGYLALPSVNTPLWHPLLLMLPVGLSLLAICLSLKTLLQGPEE